MTLSAQGFEVLKFFPAEPAGGAPFLKALSGPLPGIRFMPTGGISPTNAPDYLALKSVVAVGGSWLASKDDIAQGNWAGIEAKARTAAQLK